MYKRNAGVVRVGLTVTLRIDHRQVTEADNYYPGATTHPGPSADDDNPGNAQNQLRDVQHSGRTPSGSGPTAQHKLRLNL